MLNEGFWIFLSFVSLVLILLKYMRKGIISALDEKIRSVEISILDVEQAKKNSEANLATLKSEHDKALMQYEKLISEAKSESEKILNDTETKVQLFYERSNELLNEYKKKSEEAMIESLKGDILVTVLHMLEEEQQRNKPGQMKGIENSLNVIKKIWN